MSIEQENCEHRTDNVQGQMSGHIFAPNGGSCLYYPSNIFRNTRGFKNWGRSSDIPQFWLGNIRSRDALRPIARERKYLMDYKTELCMYYGQSLKLPGECDPYNFGPYETELN